MLTLNMYLSVGHKTKSTKQLTCTLKKQLSRTLNDILETSEVNMVQITKKLLKVAHDRRD